MSSRELTIVLLVVMGVVVLLPFLALSFTRPGYESPYSTRVLDGEPRAHDPKGTGSNPARYPQFGTQPSGVLGGCKSDGFSGRQTNANADDVYF